MGEIGRAVRAGWSRTCSEPQCILVWKEAKIRWFWGFDLLTQKPQLILKNQKQMKKELNFFSHILSFSGEVNFNSRKFACTNTFLASCMYRFKQRVVHRMWLSSHEHMSHYPNINTCIRTYVWLKAAFQFHWENDVIWYELTSEKFVNIPLVNSLSLSPTHSYIFFAVNGEQWFNKNTHVSKISDRHLFVVWCVICDACAEVRI